MSAAALADRQALESGLGTITWWGFSPGLDLLQTWLDTAEEVPTDDRPLNVLIVGSGDQRHLLTTIARRSRHFREGSRRRQLRVHILEADCSLYCRACLQLALCLDSRSSVQERAELFLELYGNILVREQTVEYVTRLCPALIRLVTDAEYGRRLLPLLNLDELKFKERDVMEAVFKFWRKGLTSRGDFDAQLCWNLRLRQHLGVRYDAIPNVFDWDHQMRLVERSGGNMVSRPEYLHWRAKGVAFRLREGAYDASNRTLCSGVVLSVAGERHARRGYWGDIVCSPYLGWGLRSEWPDYAKTANGQLVNTCGSVCEFNVCSVMHELRTEQRYSLPEPPAETAAATSAADANHLTVIEESPDATDTTETGAATAAAVVEAPTEAKHETATDEIGSAGNSEPEFIPIDDVTVTFLPLGSLPTLANKAKYRGLFDIVHFANSSVHNMAESGVAALLADTAVVVAESALYMLELKPDQIAQYSEKVAALAAGLGARPARPPDPTKDAHLVFTRQPPL